LKKISDFIRKNRSFILTTHAVPDGDGLGSQVALHRTLLALGKKSTILNSHPTPAKFDLIDPQLEIRVYDGKSGLPRADGIFILDTHDCKMLGSLEAAIRATKIPVVFLDHHVPDTVGGLPKGLHLIDESYGSTGELVFALLKDLKFPIDLAVALPLYVSILTDTGSFRFNRTTAHSHRVVAELLETGISPEDVYEKIYARDSFAKVRLLGHVLENVVTSEDDRVAWLTISKTMRDKFGASVEDTEAYVGHLTLLEKVDIGLLFREEDDGRIKVSFRGNRNLPILDLAKQFGGGGHRYSAGVRMDGPLEAAILRVSQAAVGYLLVGRMLR
jgi:phosphoesterase RecJ-like protein